MVKKQTLVNQLWEEAIEDNTHSLYIKQLEDIEWRSYIEGI